MDVKDTFKILVSSDINLGHMEDDPIRGQDSFNTFEEILEEAKKYDVDFILLGGNLFHERNPSLRCLHQCMSLLRRYCLGNKPISFRIVSDEAENFRHCVNTQVNYQDQNINVSIPVLSIHGNHDDPSDHFQLSSLNLLSSSGLLNYFGRCADLTKIDVTPLLFTKGTTKLAIYGLGYIEDERLARLFKDEKIQMDRPKQDTENWYNIFVCHQNRVDRGVNNYLRKEALPEFLDLILWGHEHECRITPERNKPGNPVTTSLCEGEAKPKHIGILEIANKVFKMKKIVLKTVSDNSANNVQKYLAEKIETCIEEAARMRIGHKKQPKEPLIRLQIEYRNENEYLKILRFGQNYQHNPALLILMREHNICYGTNMKYAPENLQDLKIDEMKMPTNDISTTATDTKEDDSGADGDDEDDDDDDGKYT